MFRLITLTAIGGCAISGSAQQFLYRMAGRHPVHYWRFVISAGSLYYLSWFFWLWVLKTTPLSTAVPLMGMGYVITAVFCRLLFREQVNGRRWIAITAIVVGVAIVSSFGD